MKNFIIIGGASRTGTNTLSTFLHLHPDVCMIRGYPTEAQVRPAKDRPLIPQIKNQLPVGLQDLLHGWVKNSWGKEQIMDNEGIFGAFVVAKNAKIDADTFTSFPMVGVRWDFAELSYDNFVASVDVPIKFIYSMREDLEALYLSTINCGYISGPKVFYEKLMQSVEKAREIKKQGAEIIAIDITAGYALREYSRMLTFLGLEITDKQWGWISAHPRTNIFLGEKKVLDIAIPQYIWDAYQEIKEELC